MNGDSLQNQLTHAAAGILVRQSVLAMHRTQVTALEELPMKNILLIATGGTIASAEEGDGLSPALSGEDLVRAVPQIAGIAHVDVAQTMNIDSTNMRPADWLAIAHVIEQAYGSYDGFAVLHGTDTMSYTAAALSYLIQESGKPIVLTGSQQPMGNPFTDARLNLFQSILYAADDRSRDVSIVFGGAVIAGTRGRKQRTMSFNAFKSVNYPSLAYIRTDLIIRSGMPGAMVSSDSEGTSGDPRFSHTLDDRVCVVRLTPGLTPHVFDLLRPDYDGVILETFGIGGVPDYADAGGRTFQDAIFGWVDSGRTLVMTTQVPEEGLDLDVYEVGRAYAEHPGILKGGDMTTEALVAKTMWALGQTRDQMRLAELFYRPVNFDRTM